MSGILDRILHEFTDHPIQTTASALAILTVIVGLFIYNTNFISNNTNHIMPQTPINISKTSGTIPSTEAPNKSVVTENPPEKPKKANVINESPPNASYIISNEYTEDSLKPSCTPGSKEATCSSPDSCVDCNSKCWSSGSYPNGICSKGKWTLKEPEQTSGYSRTNEYTGDGLKPSCTPGSKQTTCSSPDSCVDCDGKCWSPGSYPNGICSKGKWTLKEPEQTSGFARTNEYTSDSIKPSCTPGSKQATCSSPDSCVDCSGQCWSPGSYPNGICSNGKWTLKVPEQTSGHARTNEYTGDSIKPSCTPGSKQATCSSPDSCVDCNSNCWLPGSYDNGKTICSQGSWKLS